jgi:hypothetical protein
LAAWFLGGSRYRFLEVKAKASRCERWFKKLPLQPRAPLHSMSYGLYSQFELCQQKLLAFQFHPQQ